ncbi:MAG TPA: cohesin domain-containing protein, partial [Bacteroidales bacterium]|nr:cohesin domain-containing protein [Bacteroidales bacterium]
VQLLLTSSENCAQPAVATSNTVTISVQTPPVAVISILPSQNPVCQGTQVTFSAQLLNGGTNPTIQWYVNSSLQSSGTALSFSYVPNNNDVVEAVMTSTLSCVSNNPALSNGIIMEVSPMLIPQVSISTPSTTLCSGQQAIVTATPVNGGTSPVYQWLLNGNPAGTNSPTFTFVPANGNQLALTMSSSLACISGNPATSNTLTFTVNPVALSLNVSPSGAGTANFTGTPTIGQPIQLSASPSAGFNFQSWTDGLGNVVSTQANFSFTPTLCNHSLTANFSSGITLSGKLAYFNPVESPLPPQSNFMVQLFDGNNPVGAPQAVSPNYSFGGLQAGKAYTIRLWEDHTSGNLGQTWNFNNWGGVSALDALIVSYMSSENPVVATFPWILPVAGQPMTPFATTSADVNNSNSITGLDALIMMYRTIGYPGTSPFPDGKHNFQVAGRWSGSAGAMLYPTAPDILLQPNGSYQASSATASVYYQALLPNTINGANYFNIYLLANGDLNASYTPAAVSAKNGAILSYEGSIPASVGQTINIPVRINQSHRLAAITLGLSYNKQLLEVNGLQGFDIFYVDQQAGEVRVAWMDQQGRDYASGQSLLNIQAKVTGNIQPGTRFMELTNITEFVNTGAQTLSNVPLASDYI